MGRRKAGEPDPGCSVEGCDRKHYAKGLCFTHWRAAKGYGPGGDRKAAITKYEQSDAGAERRHRAAAKRLLIRRFSGCSRVADAFTNPESLRLMASKEGVEELWPYLTSAQKKALWPHLPAERQQLIQALEQPDQNDA
ncbi:MAG: hypothetical protein ACHWZW_02770 [Spirulina sp.]